MSARSRSAGHRQRAPITFRKPRRLTSLPNRRLRKIVAQQSWKSAVSASSSRLASTPCHVAQPSAPVAPPDVAILYSLIVLRSPVTDRTIREFADFDVLLPAGGHRLSTYCSGDRSVTIAIGHGRRAAEHRRLAVGVSRLPSRAVEPGAVRGPQHLVLRGRPDRTHRPRLELARRQLDLRRGRARPRRDTALYEARRCLSCGSCFSCDNCYALCPTTP